MKQVEQVAFTLFGLDVVFAEDGIADSGDGGWLLNQRPDARADDVEPVIDGILQVEDRRLTGQIAEDLILRRRDRRCRRDRPVHAVTSTGSSLTRSSSSAAAYTKSMHGSAALTGGLAAVINGSRVPWIALGVTAAELLETCNEDGLTGLVHQSLRAQAGGDWPEGVQADVASRTCAAAAEETLRRRETISALDALASAGVTPILLKGTALAYTVYAVPSYRPRADTDLLIPREHVAAARHVMADLGFVESANSGGERLFAQFQFWKEDAYGVQHVFDFHWKISTQPTFADVLTFGELAAASVPVGALGEHARAAATVHALLLACIHPAMHHRNAEHLIWMYDIHLLASRLSATDFDRLVDIALAKKVGAVCAHELARARSRFDFPLPPRVIGTLGERSDEPSAAYLRSQRRWVDELISSMQGLPRWGDRLGLLREIVFPSARYMLAAYGMAARPSLAAMLPALYAHRILKGIQKVAAGRK